MLDMCIEKAKAVPKTRFGDTLIKEQCSVISDVNDWHDLLCDVVVLWKHQAVPFLLKKTGFP